MTEDVIEQYNTFNTKGCPEDLIFGGFGNQPIPPTYSDLKNDYDGYFTSIDSVLEDNKEVKYAVMPNDENNYDKILASEIDPPQTILRKLK